MFGLEGRALADFAISSGEEYVLLATARKARSRGAGDKSSRPAGARPAARSSRPGGPDAELSVAVRPRSGTVIGGIVPAREGITLVDARGRRRPLPALGYEHSF